MDSVSDEHYLKIELYQRFKEEPALLEFLEEGSLDGIWYWDIENPSVAWMSVGFKALFGYKDHEIPSVSSWWQENIFPEDLEVAYGNFRGHLADPAHPYDQVVRYRHKDGSTVWVRCRGLAIRNQDGEPIRLLGVHIDETALHRQIERSAELNTALMESNRTLAQREMSAAVAKREAEDSARSLKLLFEVSPVGKAILGQGGIIRESNPALYHLFGYTRDEMKGMPLGALLPRLAGNLAQIGDEGWSLDQSRAPGWTELSLDSEGVHKDGKTLIVSMGVVNLPRTDEAQVLVTMIDITERHRSEAKLKAYGERLNRTNGELANFSRAAAHDLQTPLRGVRNLTSWLEEDLDSGNLPGARAHLDRLVSQVGRMQRLIDGLLRYSSADSFNMRPIRLDLGQLVRADWSLLEPPDGMTLAIPVPFPELVTAATPLRQCLRNLLDNAIKHHDREGGAVSVTWRDEGDFLRFEVRDDGPGIPEEHQGMIFLFLRTLKPQGDSGGPGLGLALVSKIVERVGGKVGVRSKVGSGSCFWFTWPKRMPAPDAPLY